VPPDGAGSGSATRRRGLRGFLLSTEGWPYLLVPFIPVAVALELLGASPAAIFFAAAAGVIPTAALMGRSTEELAARSGPGVGGLLNVTFGNAPELIIAFFALLRGLQEVVKASVIGSIVGNTLLVLGAAMFIGGLGRDRQRFNRTAVTTQTTMLLLAVVALVLPAVLALAHGDGLPRVGTEIVDFDPQVEQLSFAVALVLLAVYAAGLLFSLVTHRGLFNPGAEGDGATHHLGEPWTVRRSVALLAVAGVAVAVMSEILVDSITEASESVGLSQFFVGAIVVAIVGNAAEHWVAILVARKNQMDLAVNIAIGSSAQVALFVAPVLVLLSFAFGPSPLALVLNGYELAAVLLAVVVAIHVTNEGESTWFEGVQLLGVYLIVGLAFLFA
jgi:Ca2+:H+ antiporter